LLPTGGAFGGNLQLAAAVTGLDAFRQPSGDRHLPHRLREIVVKQRIVRHGQIQAERVVGQNADIAASGQRQGARQRAGHLAWHHDRQRDPIVIALGGNAGHLETLRRRPVPGCGRRVALPDDSRRDAAFAWRAPVGFPAFLQLDRQQQTGLSRL